jgi:molybdate transport system ATP-binding protein
MTLAFMARNAAPIPLDLEFRVRPKELLALVGRSGAGKTSVLRAIAGLWTPATARVQMGEQTWVDSESGVSWPARQRRVGVVFQSYALFPHLSAEQNVAAAIDDLPRGARLADARRLLALAELVGFESRRPAELSGGQQQRVAIARALARRPRVLLLDEPFSAVDQQTRRRLRAQILGLRDTLGIPIILVTHDLEDARALADHVLVIEQGCVAQYGTTREILYDPASLRALGLRELAVSLRAVIEAHDSDGLTRLATSAGPLFVPTIEGVPGQQVELRIPAHEVLLSTVRPDHVSALNVLPASVERIVPGDGPGAVVHLRCGGQLMLARVTQRSVRSLALVEGMACFAILKALSISPDGVLTGKHGSGGR